MSKFLQGRCVFFGVPFQASDGTRTAFSHDSFDGLDGSKVPIAFNHSFVIADGRLRVRPDGVYFEAEIAGKELEAVEELFRKGRIQGASYTICGESEERFGKHGAYQWIRKVSAVTECGPNEKPCQILSTCRLTTESLFPSGGIPVARKRPLMNLNREIPEGMLNASRIIAAARQGVGCEIRGRYLNASLVQNLFRQPGAMAIF